MGIPVYRTLSDTPDEEPEPGCGETTVTSRTVPPGRTARSATPQTITASSATSSDVASVPTAPAIMRHRPVFQVITLPLSAVTAWQWSGNIQGLGFQIGTNTCWTFCVKITRMIIDQSETPVAASVAQGTAFGLSLQYSTAYADTIWALPDEMRTRFAIGEEAEQEI